MRPKIDRMVDEVDPSRKPKYATEIVISKSGGEAIQKLSRFFGNMMTKEIRDKNSSPVIVSATVLKNNGQPIEIPFEEDDAFRFDFLDGYPSLISLPNIPSQVTPALYTSDIFSINAAGGIPVSVGRPGARFMGSLGQGIGRDHSSSDDEAKPNTEDRLGLERVAAIAVRKLGQIQAKLVEDARGLLIVLFPNQGKGKLEFPFFVDPSKNG